MARQSLTSKFGTVKFLKNNPRTIRPDAFKKLVESIERDPDFMIANPIKVDETGTVLGGNQRCRALLALGYDRVPDDWIRRVSHADGTPFTPEEKERLVYIDNSPEGVSGEFDYAAMVSGTSLDLLRDVGIDLAKIDLPEEARVEFEGEAEAEIERESPIGEESEALQKIHAARDKSREKFNDLSDFGFYGVLVFQTYEQRRAFGKWCAEHDVRAKYDALFLNGEDLCKAVSVSLPKCRGGAIRERVPNAVLESMTLDGGNSSGDADEVLEKDAARASGDGAEDAPE